MDTYTEGENRVIDQICKESTIHLDIPATFQYLHIGSLCIQGVLSQVTDVQESEILSYNVQLAVQEICANIVQHAYAEEHKGQRIQLAITLQEQPRRLLVELFDTGMAFDETQVKEPDLEQPQARGYGLFLAKRLMDEVTYHQLSGGNRWRLAKNL